VKFCTNQRVRVSDKEKLLLLRTELGPNLELLVLTSGSAADQARHGGSQSPGGVSHLIMSEPRFQKDPP